MILRDFVSQALCNIVGGVQDAQTKTPEGTVVPSNITTKMYAVEAGISSMQVIDFEVTVKADEKAGREAGLSVVAAVFGVGGGIKSESGKSDGHAATLKFRVPVRLPSSGKVT